MLPIKKTLVHPKANEEKHIIFQKKVEEYKKEKISLAYINESEFANDMPRTHTYTERGSRYFGIHDWHAKGCKNVITLCLDHH